MGQPATNKLTGMAIASVPDTCNTPAPPAAPVPIPYPNIAQIPLISGEVSTKVKIAGAPAVMKGAKTPLSNGDEAGVTGGVSSGSFIGEMECAAGSSKVKVEGKPAVRMGDQTKHNKGNTMGSITVPSQAFVMMG